MALRKVVLKSLLFGTLLVCLSSLSAACAVDSDLHPSSGAVAPISSGVVSELAELDNGDAYFSPISNDAFNLDLTALESSLKSLSPNALYLSLSPSSSSFNMLFRPSGEIDSLNIQLFSDYSSITPEGNVFKLNETTVEFENEPVSPGSSFTGEHSAIEGYYIQRQSDDFFEGPTTPKNAKDFFVSLTGLRKWLEGPALEAVINDYGNADVTRFNLILKIQQVDLLENSGVPVVYLDCSDQFPMLMERDAISEVMVPPSSVNGVVPYLEFQDYNYLTLYEYYPFEEGMIEYEK